MPAAAKPNYGTGRRKTSAARVFLKPGSGAPGSDAILAMGRLILDHALPPGPPP